MIVRSTLFVSKRLLGPAAALLCLMAAQLALAIASQPPAAVGAVRVAIAR